MNISRTVASLCVVALNLGCGSDEPDPTASQSGSALTYYDDIAPIVQEHCLQCHQEGGIGPIRLDDYQTAKANAASIADETVARRMPPWSATSDGTCGEFSGSLSLSDDEIAKFSNWAEQGAKEGKPRALEVPPKPSLAASTPYRSPNFTPVIQGGRLSASDEYRCFLLDSGVSAQKFITGYEVTPGNDAMIHHVLGLVVDPSEKAALRDEPNLTNGELMARLHAQTPDREGWSCFSMAGPGVNVAAIPVIWGPGQGVVEYPVNSGVPLKPSDKIVIQVHYNMHDMSLVGQSDQTTIKLRLADNVERVGIFVVNDPLLDSLGDPTPVQLAPGKPSVKYDWSQTLADFGLANLPDLQLNGVAPHMHQLGRKYRLQVSTAGNEACGLDVKNWDFYWQRMYFYTQPRALDAQTLFKITCDYDTTSVSDPVQPGWGTKNEMCLVALYLTAPAAAFQTP